VKVGGIPQNGHNIWFKEIMLLIATIDGTGWGYRSPYGHYNPYKRRNYIQQLGLPIRLLKFIR